MKRSEIAKIDPQRISDPRAADALHRIVELARVDPEKLESAEHSEIVAAWQARRALRLAVLKHQIVDLQRVDLLATEVLGYQAKPFHVKMMQFQLLHRDNLQLVFRGAGKSVTCTITKIIWYLAVWRQARIVLASKKHENATKFLSAVRHHLTGNELLIELFGHFKDPDPRSTLTWNEGAIRVLGSDMTKAEQSVTCVGVDGSVAGGHFDVEFSDDIVDNKNTQTKAMRDKTRDWYYSVLDPCMEPSEPGLPYRGDRNRLGTRYHPDDLYGHWIEMNAEEERAGKPPLMAINVIPALDDQGRSPWPEKWHPDKLMARRRKYGQLIFGAQYQCNTDAMKGSIIQYDDCQPIEAHEVQALRDAGKLEIYMGIDLAISEKQEADKFALVVIGVDSAKNVYVFHHYSARITFKKQQEKIVAAWKDFGVSRIAIEKNGFQGAQIGDLRRQYPDIPIRPIQQAVDKQIRANKLSAIFEARKVFFVRGMDIVIEQCVMMPNSPHDDSFDALELAVTASKSRVRKEREEPGVL